MAKLLIFAPCEKVIISAEENATSLISILQGFDVPMQPPVGQTAIAPVAWYVFSLWEREVEDGLGDHQRFELRSVNGDLLLHAEAPILKPEERDRKFHRT